MSNRIVVNEGSDFVIVRHSRVFGSNPEILMEVSGDTGEIRISAPISGSDVRACTDTYAATLGQTAFAMSREPRGSVEVYVNGMIQIRGVDFEVSGSEVNWISSDFPIVAGDVVQISYVSIY
jgi:hypothetical protein